MSLINQMLRDLDRREAERGPRQVVPPAPVPPRTVSGGSKLRVLWALPVIAALLVVFYYQPWTGGVFDTLFERPGAMDNQQTVARAAAVVRQEGVTSAAGTRARQPVVADSMVRPGDGTNSGPLGESLATGSLPESAEDVSTVPDGPVASRVVGSDAAAPLSAPVRESSAEQAVDKIAQRPIENGESGESVANTEKTGRANRTESLVTVRVDNRRDPVTQEAPPVKADAMQPEIPLVEQPRIKVQKVAPRTVQESAASVYATALMYLEEGESREAMAALRHCLSLDRTHTGARRLLVMLLLKGGERQEAIALLDAGLNIAPGTVSLAILRGRLLMDDGDLPAAIKLLEQQRSIAGDDAELLSLLGSVYQQLGQFSAAVGIYRRLSEQQPDNARALAGLAISLDATGDQAEALSVYRAALHFDTLPNEVSEYARKRVSALSGGR